MFLLSVNNMPQTIKDVPKYCQLMKYIVFPIKLWQMLNSNYKKNVDEQNKYRTFVERQFFP